MERLIREFGAWLKQGFGWLVDVIVFGCLWGIGQISRLLGTHWGGAPILKILVLLLVLLLILYAFYWVFGRFIGVIRWALCARSDSVQRSRSIGSVRQCGSRFGCGALGDAQPQLSRAVSHRAVRYEYTPKLALFWSRP